MNVKRAENTLLQIGKFYKDLLDDSAEWILQEAASRLIESHDLFKAGHIPQWGYEITDERPLRFRPSPIGGYLPEVDIYCSIKWTDSDLPVEQDIKIRVWSNHHLIVFREGIDGERIEQELTNDARHRSNSGRVISRLHFDLARHDQGRSEQFHPRYHLQVGGNQREYELCWHPKGFDIPRIPFQPMELFLTCQLVAANFFVTEYESIKRDGVWRGYLRHYQNVFWLEYYKECLKIVEEKESLIDHLCQSPDSESD